MLITRNGKEARVHKYFSFDYYGEDAKLVCLFVAAEVCDSAIQCVFEKQDGFFVPFSRYRQSPRSATKLVSQDLKKETAEAYDGYLSLQESFWVIEGGDRLTLADTVTYWKTSANLYTPHLFIRVQKRTQRVWYSNQYRLRRWTKDLIPPNLRNKKNRYGEKNEAIEKLAMKASIILDSCVHMLRNNEPKLSVLKPDKVKVKNPTGVRPKGREKHKRIKSGREISMKKIVPGGSDHVVVGLRDGTSGSVKMCFVTV
ncbi:hypothetical protein Tco_1237103 [Tanacetum coccineum]